MEPSNDQSIFWCVDDHPGIVNDGLNLQSFFQVIWMFISFVH